MSIFMHNGRWLESGRQIFSSNSNGKENEGLVSVRHISARTGLGKNALRRRDEFGVCRARIERGAGKWRPFECSTPLTAIPGEIVPIGHSKCEILHYRAQFASETKWHFCRISMTRSGAVKSSCLARVKGRATRRVVCPRPELTSPLGTIWLYGVALSGHATWINRCSDPVAG